MDAGGVLEVAGEGECEDGNRATHQHGGRADQQCRQGDVEDETQRIEAHRAEQG